VSEGCRNCYAEKIAGRFRGEGLPYEGLTAITNGKPVWNGQIEFVEAHLLDPLKWKPVFVTCEVCGVCQHQCACEKFNHRSRRIFVNSMSDLFHENVHKVDRTLIFAVMLLCPQHTFQILTKRPERMLAWLSEPGRRSAILKAASMLAFDLQSLRAYKNIPKPENATDVVYDCGPNGDEAGCRVRDVWPLPNVWLGVSVENQKAADERIPLLLQTPAAVRFLSVEPLLGAVDLNNIAALTLHPPSYVPTQEDIDDNWRFSSLDSSDLYWTDGGLISDGPDRPGLDWVICGGESGPDARPMHPHWVRGLRDQCVAAGVPFFFKQWGEWSPSQAPDGGTLAGYGEFGPATSPVGMRRIGKKAAGHLLDGIEWHQFPEVRA
jgi:protein gp37